MPHILAVQAENCAPLAQAFQRGEEVATLVVNRGTEADAIAAPARSRQILAAIRETEGTIITVSETAIAEARGALATQGLYVEPTAAVTYAGFLACLKQARGAEHTESASALFTENMLSEASPVVIALCGAGLKAA